MKTITGYLCTTLTCCFVLICSRAHAAADITIIRNGGGASLIENTLVAATVAVTKDADYLELPLNLTSDDQLIVFKDTTLNRLTDVADLFPIRQRDDGNYYVVDFSLTELRQLRLKNVFENQGSSLSLGIPTLKEELTTIRSLNEILGKNTGVVLTLIDPSFYTGEGKNLSIQLQQTLQLLAYSPEDKIFIASADPDELQKISRWPRSESGRKYSLIQEIQTKRTTDAEQLDTSPIRYQNDWLFTNSGLRILASYAEAIAFPEEITTRKTQKTHKLLNALHDYDLKIFLQTANNPYRTDKAYDGIYLDSIDLTPQQDKNNILDSPSTPIAGQEGNTSPEQSSLPPFFSNLGLSAPNNSNQALDDEPTDAEAFSEEFESNTAQ